MCGIYCLVTEKITDFKSKVLDVKSKLNHRGPDSLGHVLIDIPGFNMRVLMVHTRLQINGNNTPQPIKNKTNTIYLIINGEIFNWHELENELNYTCSQSDCEIIIPLYEKYKDTPKKIFEKISGQYSFVLIDLENTSILVGRDHIGITPLYFAKTNSSIEFSSEMKALIDEDGNNKHIDIFPPRSYYLNDIGKCLFFEVSNAIKYITFNKYSSIYNKYVEEESVEKIHKNINQSLTNSVKSQLTDMLNNENGDFGVLLSGGLDSSLIASLVVKLAKEYGYQKKIKTFSIGTNSHAPDLIAAREVAEFLDTEHHEYHFTIDEGLKSLSDVIWYIESYDCTSVRASTAMFLLTKKIKGDFPKLKVLFSGELSDELLCYLYGANAPNDDAFQDETIQLVNNVHYFDCLRANKTCMAHSIEVRVPFTDLNYVTYILSLHPKYKRFGQGRGIEKKILRDSFADNYLPQHILYRKKEQFSDGVSDFTKEYNWIDNLKEYTNQQYNVLEFNEMSREIKYNTPTTKEHLFYRKIFNNLFGKFNSSTEYTVKRWLPKWCETDDPSGRLQNFYN